jgi:hypothetical protein
MALLERLSHNKGTVSGVLSKKLAQQVLAGDTQLLAEAVRLVVYRQEEPAARHIRCGAAVIIDQVAAAQPALVLKYLPKLFPALAVGEPQTRWIIIRTIGYCAALDPKTARRAVPFAERYIEQQSILCLKSSADRFLGALGAVSAKDAASVFPILEKSIRNMVRNEADWILEAMIAMAARLAAPARGRASEFARRCESASRKATRDRAARLLKLLGRVKT